MTFNEYEYMSSSSSFFFRYLLTLMLSVGFFSDIQAQPFSAYVNAREEFYIFDNGAINRLEAIKPIEYKVGRNAIAYIDNGRNFKVYHDGNVTAVSDLFTTQFDVSDNLILYRSAKMVSVIDGSDIKNCEVVELG